MESLLRGGVNDIKQVFIFRCRGDYIGLSGDMGCLGLD